MKRGIILAAAIVLPTGGGPATAQSKGSDLPSPEQRAYYVQLVKDCIAEVHKQAPTSQFYGQFFTAFDAYYNIVNGRILDNGIAAQDAAPRYAFHKCLAEHGVSIDAPAKLQQ